VQRCKGAKAVRVEIPLPLFYSDSVCRFAPLHPPSPFFDSEVFHFYTLSPSREPLRSLAPPVAIRRFVVGRTHFGRTSSPPSGRFLRRRCRMLGDGWARWAALSHRKHAESANTPGKGRNLRFCYFSTLRASRVEQGTRSARPRGVGIRARGSPVLHSETAGAFAHDRRERYGSDEIRSF
jgi:hypothetical protein